MTTRNALLALGLLLACVATALAHEKGVIRLASKQVPVGGDVAMTGERLPKNAVLRIQLRGTLDTYPLGEVRTDAKGALRSRLTLPPRVPAGAYTLVALAPDGDVTARVDLVIAPAAPVHAAAESVAMPAMPRSAAMRHTARAMNGPHATAEMMALDRRTSPAEWAVMAALITLSVAGGVALVRKAERVTESEQAVAAGGADGGSP